MSAAHYAPTPDAVISAVESLEEYGLSAKTYLAPATPLYTLFLGTAPQAPVEFYALAGGYDLHHLAIPISSFLLSFSLASLTDELAVKMGPLCHCLRAKCHSRSCMPPRGAQLCEDVRRVRRRVSLQFLRPHASPARSGM